MNRRKALKNITLVSGCIIALPAWMQSCGLSDKQTHVSSFSEDQQKLLASIADTIIPAGDAVGALTVGVDRFLQKIFDDCYDDLQRKNIVTQLTKLNLKADEKYDNDFSGCTLPQREGLLMQFAKSANDQEKEFFKIIRNETIRGFTTSQQVMEDYLGYQVAPGHYYGCVAIKA